MQPQLKDLRQVRLMSSLPRGSTPKEHLKESIR